MGKNYLILPGCDDTNRGDQALIWETVRMAKEAGYNGNYYMVSSKEKSNQSKEEGIYNIEYILKHPSVHFKKNNNIQYGCILKFKWIFVSIIDSIGAIFLLNRVTRSIFLPFYSKSVKNSIEIYSKADKAFVKGGGFIHSYGGIISTYAVFFDLYHIILAQAMGIDVYVMPNSFGPFWGLGSKWLVKRVLKRCKIVTARESISQKTLQSYLNVKCELYPDLAFYLQPDTRFTESQSKKLDLLPNERKCVAITMRPYRFPNSKYPQKEYKKYQQNFCEFIRYLSDNNYYPVIIEHTFSEVEHEQDMSCIKDVVNLLGDSCEYVVYSDLTLNCRQLKYLYSKFDYIIGTRFHSVIFSLSAGVPAIAITYGGNKGQGIMKDLGLSEFAMDINNFELDILIKTFNSLVEKEEEIGEKIKNYMKTSDVKRKKLIKILESK